MAFEPVPMVTREAISPLFTCYEARGMQLPEYYGLTGLEPPEILIYWEEGVFHIYADRGYIERLGDGIVRRAVEEEDFTGGLRERIFQTCSELERKSQEIHDADLGSMGSDEIARMWEGRMDAHSRMFSYACLSWLAVEPIDARASRMLRHASRGKESGIARDFTLLTTSPDQSWSRIEEKELLAIASKIEGNGKARNEFILSADEEIRKRMPQQWNEISRHAERWQWLPYEYDGNDVWREPHFIKELKTILEDGNAESRIRQLQGKSSAIGGQRVEAAARLGLGKEEMSVFNLLAELIFLKEYRNGVRCKSNFLSESLLREAAKRQGCTLGQVRYLFPLEMKEFLDGKISARTLEQRRDFSCYHAIERRPAEIAAGDDARKTVMKLVQNEKTTHTSELAGRCANPGRARGIARVLFDAKEIGRVKKGDVLVARMTTPDFVPAMKRAAAIVTDDGGITCHAAIVSRELGVPCIVGTRNATRAIHDGDMIEVHAHEGTVRIMSNEVA